MWRAFGMNTPRVALVFAVPKMSHGAFALNLLLNPVAYLAEADVHALIKEEMESLPRHKEFLCSVDRNLVVGSIFDMLLVGVTGLKHEGFQEEREWRAIYCPRFNSSSLMQSHVEVVGGVPQSVFRIPLDLSGSPVLEDLDFARLFNRAHHRSESIPLAAVSGFRRNSEQGRSR